MKRKHFILAFMAMLSFAFSAFAQQTVVVRNFAELKAEIEKTATESRANNMRGVNVTNQGTPSEIFGDIKLGDNIVMEGVLEIPLYRELTLDLNGFTISGDADEYIKNLGAFSVQDNSANGTGAISCAIINAEVGKEAYLKIQNGTFKNQDGRADAAVITNYSLCEIYGGKFFSENIAMINHGEMTIDGGSPANVYIEGKNHYITNDGTLAVKNATIAGAKDDYVGDPNDFEDSVIFYNVAVNGMGYNSLSEAVAAATAGDLIRLFANVEESAEVVVDKAVTIDGNNKTLTSTSTGNAIKVNAAGIVSITDITVEGAAGYALDAVTETYVTESTLRGAGAVKVTDCLVSIQNTDLVGTAAMDVVSVAGDVTFNFEGGSITASSQTGADNFFIVGGKCADATFSIMAPTITLGAATNYLNVDTEKNVVKVFSGHEDAFNQKGYVTEKKANFMYVYSAVARVWNGDNFKNYRTLAAALDAAIDGSKVELLYGDYDRAPISMVGTVCGGKTVTITGTADVDWSKGWFFVGRGGEGNGKVIFDNANLTSSEASLKNGTYGINVSMAKYGEAKTNDGEVVFKNSNIELSYLRGMNNVTVDGSNLKVWYGFAVTARPASETNDVERTTTMNIVNGSKVVVIKHNGMGLGYEGLGVMNIDATSAFECTEDFLVAAKGTMNINGGTLNATKTVTNNGAIKVSGESTLYIEKLTGEDVNFLDGAIINNSTIGGNVFVAGNVTFRGANTFAMLYDYGTLTDYYGTTAAMKWTVEEGASVKLTNAARYGLGYGDNVTVKGNIGDALTARENLTEADRSLFMHGLVAQESMGWNCSSALNVENAYVVIGSNNSFGNKPGNYGGTYTFNIKNSVVDASRITFYEALSTTTFTIENSDVKMGTFMTRDADSKFILRNSKVLATTTTNGTDEGNYNKGELTLEKSTLTYSAEVKHEAGVINLDLKSLLTAPKFSGAGTINVDTEGITERVLVVNANMDDFTGAINVGVADYRITDEGLEVLPAVACLNGDKYFAVLQDAIDACGEGGNTITLLKDVKEDVTVVQAPNVKITIDGDSKTLKGTITVDGKSSYYDSAALTIENVNFDAREGVAYDACVRLGDGTQATRYTNHVTVKGCTFIDNGYSTVAVKSYTGGDYNLQIIDCEADGMHSLAQLANVMDGLVISDNTVNTKNGINLNSTVTATIENNTINVKGYAVRVGANGQTGGDITLTNNTLTTESTEDPVIELRGTAVEALRMSKNVVSGATHITGTATTVAVDANYWDGNDAPVANPAVRVNSYYADAALQNLIHNHYGNDFFGYTSEYAIWGEVWGNAFHSFVINVLDANGNVMGTTSLNNVDGIINGNVNVTWNLLLDAAANEDPYWNMSWTTRPTVDNMPARVQLVVDGDVVGGGPVQLNNPDNLAVKTVAISGADGYIKSFHTSFKEAVAAVQEGETITILSGVHSENIKLPATLKNVTIKGTEGAVLKNMTISAADGNTVNYEGLTFDGITFDNSNVVLTGWRTSGVVYKDITVNGCTFKNIVRTNNEAAFHINCDANEAVNGFTFTNNVIEGISGASNSGIYAQVTGNVVVENNVINNVAFRPYVIQVTTNDGIADNFVVKGNTFSGSAVGRAQGLGNDAAGTDAVSLVVSNNIFKDITNAQQICYWSFNPETTTTEFSHNYYDFNILANTGKFYYNAAAADASDLVAMGVYPYYAGLNVDGTIDEESIVYAPVAVTNYQGYATINEAIEAAVDGGTVEILAGEHSEYVKSAGDKSVTIVGSKNFGTTLTGGMMLGVDNSQCNANTVVVKDLKFTGKGIVVASQENVVIENNVFENITDLVATSGTATENAISVVGKNVKAVVKDNTITGVKVAGIMLRNAESADVTGNTISNTGHNAILIQGPQGGEAAYNVADNTLSNWGTSGEGRAVRISAIANKTVTVNGNVMSHASAPEEFVKISGAVAEKIDASKNYWNGDNPFGTGKFATEHTSDPAAMLKNYWEDAEKTILVELSSSAALIGNVYYATFANALEAVQNGETIVLTGVAGSESGEIEFSRSIEFKITGNAPNYKLPVVTFQNATVTVEKATISIPELDARQNATINVVNSTLYGAGNDDIVKSYYNGAINIDENSTVYTMQVTTMGYINVKGTLNATWQTNVYGNGMITLTEGATFNTAALHLTGKDYSGRDNTNEERVGKPATMVVDGATLNVGKVLSSNGSDYSYNSKDGINVGTIAGKAAVLDIKNGAAVNFFMANGETAKVGADGIVNVEDNSTFNVASRDAAGTVTLANSGIININLAATVAGELTNNGTINFTSLDATLTTPTEGLVINHNFDDRYKVIYREGVYQFGDFVAEIDGVYYETIEEALQALTDNATLKFLNDVTITEKWDCRYNGAKIAANNVTIDGNGYTLKLTGEVIDNNWNTVFRVEGDNATFMNLTIDASEAAKIQRGISAKLSLTVDNCEFIGNGSTSQYGVIFGEGAGAALAGVTVSITDSKFSNSSYGVSDNRNGQDANTVTVAGNEFENAKVLLSASEKVEFNDNTVSGASVEITSWGNASNVEVNAVGNTLDTNQANEVTTNLEKMNVQDEFVVSVATSNNKYYVTLPKAIAKATADATVTLLSDVEGAGAVISKNLTIDFNGKTYTFTEGGLEITAGEVTLKNGTMKASNLASALVVNGGEVKIEGEETAVYGNIEVAEGATLLIYDGTYTMNVSKWCAPLRTAMPNEAATLYTIVSGITLIDGQFSEYTVAETQVVDYIYYQRTLSGTKDSDGKYVWQAFYLPFEIPMSELVGKYEVTYINDVRQSDSNGDGEIDGAVVEQIRIVRDNVTLKANYPYLIRPLAEEYRNFVVSLEDATLYAAQEVKYECSSIHTQFFFTGNVSTLDNNALKTKYALSGGAWKYNLKSMKPFRIYIEVRPKDGGEAAWIASDNYTIGMRVAGEEDETGATIIYDVVNDAQTVDYIYDLQGRRVLEPKKGGLYIINGKKVIF